MEKEKKKKVIEIIVTAVISVLSTILGFNVIG